MSVDILIGAEIIEQVAAKTGGEAGAGIAVLSEALGTKKSGMAVLLALGQESTVMV